MFTLPKLILLRAPRLESARAGRPQDFDCTRFIPQPQPPSNVSRFELGVAGEFSESWLHRTDKRLGRGIAWQAAYHGRLMQPCTQAEMD